MAEINEPLRAMMKEHMSGTTRRTANVASKEELSDHALTDDRVRTWRAAQMSVAHIVTPFHPHPDFEVLTFSDAPDAYWGRFLTHVPRSEFHGGVRVEDSSHQPLAFLKGFLSGSAAQMQHH